MPADAKVASRVLCFTERDLHDQDQGHDGRMTSEPQGRKVPKVRCPSCGQFLLEILEHDGDFAIRIKCKASGCKKILTVRTARGAFSVETAA